MIAGSSGKPIEADNKRILTRGDALVGINKIQFQKGLLMVRFMDNCRMADKCHAALVASVLVCWV